MNELPLSLLEATFDTCVPPPAHTAVAHPVPLVKLREGLLLPGKHSSTSLGSQGPHSTSVMALITLTSEHLVTWLFLR
jgi:hypothetical protein